LEILDSATQDTPGSPVAAHSTATPSSPSKSTIGSGSVVATFLLAPSAITREIVGEVCYSGHEVGILGDYSPSRGVVIDGGRARSEGSVSLAVQSLIKVLKEVQGGGYPGVGSARGIRSGKGSKNVSACVLLCGELIRFSLSPSPFHHGTLNHLRCRVYSLVGQQPLHYKMPVRGTALRAGLGIRWLSQMPQPRDW